LLTSVTGHTAAEICGRPIEKLFNLEERIPAGHLLRRINPIVTRLLANMREKLAPFYSDIGRGVFQKQIESMKTAFRSGCFC
jgi:hypothetical protein